MSVGIDEIDNEHKVLIAIIAELSDAINDENTDSIIFEIFDRLESYVKKHFSNEEKLMGEFKYSRLEAHKKQHQKFIAKIAEFKVTLLDEYSIHVAEEVNLFLFNWLTNHILIEDMRFSLPAYEGGFSNFSAKKPRGLKRISTWLGSTIPLRRRILLTALLPIVGVLLLSGTILMFDYQQLANMRSLLGQSQVVQTINELTHSLQAERGLSTGYISTDSKRYIGKLADQRNTSDQQIAKFNDEMRHKYYAAIANDETSAYFNRVSSQLAMLEHKRNGIDQKNIPINEMQRFYTQLITLLFEHPNAIKKLELESNMALKIAAYTSTLRLKEAGGLQRALGVEVIESRDFTPQNYKKFSHLSGEQHGLLLAIKQVLTTQQKERWQPLYHGVAEREAQSYQEKIYQAAANEQLLDLNSQKWFTVMSNKLNELKILADQIALDIDTHANNNIQTLENRLNYSAAVLFIILALTVLSSCLLNMSIISPVHRITKAMKRLALGFNDFHFFNKFANDELGEMVRAYEACRINLLRIDIAKTVHSCRQDFKLKIKIKEREHFRNLASIDPLTGALNRREFNKLAQYEIDITHRYARPFSLMMIDLDHFKKINDTYGHAGGDLVLKAFYDACHRNVREIDIIARIGGEEFVLLMPETSAKQAYDLAERIRTEVSKLSIPIDDSEAKITISIGIVEWNKKYKKEINDLLADADLALYKAKNSGRNQSVIFKEALIKS